ncbi:MAG: RCC1 domain-containing protein [Acidimicrobiales bacterium]
MIRRAFRSTPYRNRALPSAVALTLIGGVCSAILGFASPANAVDGPTPDTIAAGHDHSLVVRFDGSVWAFGSNTYGQLGTAAGSTGSDPHPTPAQVPGLTDVTDVAAGLGSSLALRADGTVWGFGFNDLGQLGTATNNGTTNDNPVPTVVPGLTDVTAIAAGETHSLALRSNGTVYGFGGNEFGQLGTTANITPNPTATVVPGLSNITDIAAGSAHSLAVRNDGTVWALGLNEFGQLGTTTNNGASVANSVATQVPGLTNIVAVAAGKHHSLALAADGTVWAFGLNDFGQLGSTSNLGASVANPTPAVIAGLSGVIAIEAGDSHSLAVRADGSTWSFGSNQFGQLGRSGNSGNTTPNPVPAQITSLSDATSVSGGDSYSFSLLVTGSVRGFGVNNVGQLGTTVNSGSTNANAAPLLSSVAGVNQPGGGLVSVVPARLLDSRPGQATVDSQSAGQGLRSEGTVTALPVLGRGGVPSDASAVVLNVTVTEGTGLGFVTVWPCGADRPLASSLNFVAGQTVPNAVLVKVGTNGRVCFYNEGADVQFIADVTGYFPAGGAFGSVVPARLLDSRPGQATVDGNTSVQGIRPAGTTTTLQVGGRGGVPSDASAVALNVTATEGTGLGFVTVWPCGTDRPLASNLNFVAGQTVPNAVIVKVGTSGTVCLYNEGASVNLIADVTGYFPAGDAFGTLVPARLLDSRPGRATVDGQAAAEGVRPAGFTTTLPVTGRGGVPGDASAVALNVTVTEGTGLGFVTVWPCGTDRPLASNLNFVAGQTVPNAVIVKVGTSGTVCLYNEGASVNLIADVIGYVPAA